MYRKFPKFFLLSIAILQFSCTNTQVKKEIKNCQEPDWTIYGEKYSSIKQLELGDNGVIYAKGRRPYVISSNGQLIAQGKKDFSVGASYVYDTISAIDKEGNQYIAYDDWEWVKKELSGNENGFYYSDQKPQIIKTGFSLSQAPPQFDPNIYDHVNFLYLVKVNISGEIIWTIKEKKFSRSQAVSSRKEVAYDLTQIFVDANLNTYLTYRTQSGFYRIRKYNSSGMLLWTINPLVDENGKEITWATYRGVPLIAVSPSEEIFLSYGNGGVMSYLKDDSGKYSNVFLEKKDYLSKFDANGNLLWKREETGYPLLQRNRVRFGKDGSIYLVGTTWGNLFTRERYGEGDAVLIKYNSEGHVVWGKQYGTSKDDFAYDLAFDDQENIFLTGFTMGEFSGFTNKGSGDLYLLRLDAEGEVEQTCQIGSSFGEAGHALLFDAEKNLYIGGYTAGTLNTTGERQRVRFFLLKYNIAE